MPFTDTVKLVEVITADTSLLNAETGDVLLGKHFIGGGKTPNVGSIPINPEQTDITISAGQSHLVPNGYNPISYHVNAQSLSEETHGTATAENILSSKTAWVNGISLTGTMPEIGKETATLVCGSSHTISKGYHDGTGKVTAIDLASQTSGNAQSEHILHNYTAWVNGSQVVGNIPIVASETVFTIIPNDTLDIAKGYYDGTNTVVVDSSATATADKIYAGQTAWVNNVLVTGTMTVHENQQISLGVNETYTIPEGYHPGGEVVVQNIPTMSGQVIAPTKDTQVIDTGGKYLTDDIVVSGVDALDYRFNEAYMYDKNGIMLNSYKITEEESSKTVNLKVDNWHDASSVNVYRVDVLELIEGTTEPDLSSPPKMSFFIYKKKGITETSKVYYKVGETVYSITVGFSTTDECQFLQFSGFESGTYVAITDMSCMREYD